MIDIRKNSWLANSHWIFIELKSTPLQLSHLVGFNQNIQPNFSLQFCCEHGYLSFLLSTWFLDNFNTWNQDQAWIINNYRREISHMASIIILNLHVQYAFTFGCYLSLIGYKSFVITLRKLAALSSSASLQ